MLGMKQQLQVWREKRGRTCEGEKMMVAEHHDWTGQNEQRERVMAEHRTKGCRSVRQAPCSSVLAAGDGLCVASPRQSLRHLRMWDSDGTTATRSNAYWQAKSSKALRDSKWEMMSFMGGSG